MDMLSIVVIVIAIAIVIGGLYIAIKNKGLRQTAISLIVEAEKAFEYGKNSEKFNYVFDKFYSKLPVVLKFLLTKDNVVMFIQEVFNEIKTALNTQPK